MIIPMLKLRNNNKGAASLLMVVFVALILSVLVIGFIRIALKEAQTATDTDLANRAFYAAEAGLEDGIRAIRQYLTDPSSIDLTEDDCAPPEDIDEPNKFSANLSADNEFDTAYTCLLIDMSPEYYEAELGRNETKQLTIHVSADNTGNSDPLVRSLIIEWHINEDEGGDGLNPPLRSATNLPPMSDWSDISGEAYPAMLRTYIFSYSEGNLNGAEIRDSDLVAYLNPASQGFAEAPIDYVSGNPGSADSLGVYNADCLITRDYVCRQVIDVNTNGRNHILRLSSLYASTHIRLHLENNQGDVIEFDGLQAVIDSTGRAGDVYRRIEKRVDLSAVFGDLLPDYAVQSADDLCKDLVVYSSSLHENNCP